MSGAIRRSNYNFVFALTCPKKIAADYISRFEQNEVFRQIFLHIVVRRHRSGLNALGVNNAVFYFLFLFFDMIFFVSNFVALGNNFIVLLANFSGSLTNLVFQMFILAFNCTHTNSVKSHDCK